MNATTSSARIVTKMIQLQSIGYSSALPAAELRIGDTMVWNFGGTSTITGVAKETKCFITYTTTGEDDGETWTSSRRLKKDRLVGFQVPKSADHDEILALVFDAAATLGNDDKAARKLARDCADYHAGKHAFMRPARWVECADMLSSLGF